MAGPLSGIRVIDLSQQLAGPYGSMILADLGAEVIKIEAPEGDGARFSTGPTHKGESFFYLAWNRNKKDIVLDLATPAGREAFYDLVRIADIVWDNFRAGSMKRLGADYATLKKINPRIICCSITGYGPTGPSRDRPAFDIAILAASGIVSLTAEPGQRPVRPGAPIADMGGGLFGVIGVLAALAERERTGMGQKLDISMLNCCLSLLSYPFSYYFCSGIVPQPISHSGHLAAVPYGIYDTKKGYIAIGPSWPRIARAIGADWLIDDPRFKDASARVEHRNELNDIIVKHLAKAEAKDWLEIFKAEDIPAEVVRALDQVAADPQVLQQNMIVTMPHPLGGAVKLVGNPIKTESTAETEFTPPPLKDQHRQEILSGLLGYSQQKIAQLKQEEEEHTQERRTHVRKLL